jgi:hypothetical protein
VPAGDAVTQKLTIELASGGPLSLPNGAGDIDLRGISISGAVESLGTLL